ncbi:MAG: tryptophan synthase subunit beta, partial [Candidatus Omnitrophica bacterium]|nr:tryptophan synthase subunit beta [Candidatus Omnitrophota bacterium]
YAGRPTPLCFAENLTRKLNGSKLYIKLEGLANTGAHKINNALGQVLIAKYMGKRKVIAETGAGQHGVAVAASSAKLGLECEIFMGAIDVERQRPNVFLMEQYGAKVTVVTSGTKILKDAVNATLKSWAECSDTAFYVLGSALGPYPYPDMVAGFQSIIGNEIRKDILDIEGRLPDVLIACCGGGSNAIGTFKPFIDDKVRLVAVEAGGIGDKPGENAVRMSGSASKGIVEGYKSFFLQTDEGQILATHSISAGLDYPGIGPELASLGRSGRIEFMKAYDEEVLNAYQEFAQNEGLIFALESAHAAAAALRIVPQMDKNTIAVVTMSGRGDKDIFITAKSLDAENWIKFLKSECDGYEY